VDRRAIRLIVDDDLERSRVTVFFRLFLAIPHFLWLALWASLALLLAIANSIATVVSGEPSPTLHRFLSAYTRYATHVVSYVSLAANPFPGFTGRRGSYPIDLEVDPPGRQNRWTAAFRLILALPAVLLADVMVGFGTSFSGGASTYGGGIVATVSFLGWFASLARGRMPLGFRDLVAYAISYSAQVGGYLLLLTARYPDPDPALGPWSVSDRRDPIWLTVDDDLGRSRLTVFFRLLLAFPHFVWLVLWGIAVLFAALASWFITLARGRTPPGLHRFISAYLRYQTHVYAYVLLVANPFPGFVGQAGTYSVEVEIDPSRGQNRWITGFRLVLAVPAFIVSGAITGAAYVAALLGWFAALVTGRMPKGLRNLGAFALRYNAQTVGYTLLLTDRYPYSGPTAGWQPQLPGASLQEA
jgi:hypothetical protein